MSLVTSHDSKFVDAKPSSVFLEPPGNCVSRSASYAEPVYEFRKTWAIAAVVVSLCPLAACAPARDLTVSESCSTFKKLDARGDAGARASDLRTAEPRMDETVARQVRQYLDAAEWADTHDPDHPQSLDHIKLMTDAYYRLDEICDLY